ncbi:uncharacterized protein LOC110823052 isoform X2 [Carica papaya]|uniref:uncharacterized protein LOC110823052 isoform X2 n=1 Tax=Carica papaya TaxID=3649 RepID=UPI000B8CF60E|nr:uncharacterized protein LOC110823052 isoform X2 [Carica papaya]
MATSAFRSTTRRTTIGKSSTCVGDSSSSNRNSTHRRSRSLSRFSRPLPGQDADGFSDETPAPRGRFVNTMRGSGFPEISLDDLAIELFDSFSGGGDRGREAFRKSSVSPGGIEGGVTASQRRGRSVSRQGSRGGLGNDSGGGKVHSESSNSRRRRSVSVARCQISDSENLTNYGNRRSSIIGNSQMSLSYSRAASNHRPALRRSFSQKDLKCHDGYSSQSSSLTDDEVKDINASKNGIEKTIRAVYTQKKSEHPAGDNINGGLYEAMRKEVRYAVEKIKMELEQAMAKTKDTELGDNGCSLAKTSEVLQAVSTIRRNYATKLEQSEKRKQDLLAEILLEEQHGRELSKVVKDLLPDPKNSVVEKPLRARKRSNDRNRMSKRLTEEAEKYIEDFISNVEDTDISSLDGERSDTSSTLGGMMKPEILKSPTMSKSVPVEMDGVVLPWLKWETSNDASPLSCKNKMEQLATPKSKLWDVAQGATPIQDTSNSSRGSWSPGAWTVMREDSASKFGEFGSCESQLSSSRARKLKVDVDDYLNIQSSENILHERWIQQNRINTGGLLLCGHHMFI